MLCLSLQVTAATLLPCNHETQSDETVQLTPHPCHQDTVTADADKQHPCADDCDNCQSCLFLSALGLFETEPATMLPPSNIYSTLSITHYYQFNPELHNRPPSSITLS